jgi:hypothetical protein
MKYRVIQMRNALGVVLLFVMGSANAATVSASQDQVVNGENFLFNLSPVAYLPGTSSLLTVTVQGDFNDGGSGFENVASVFIDGVNYGSYDIYSAQAYDVINYNYNAYEFSVDILLDASTTAAYLADGVFDVIIDFGSLVTVECGWSSVGNCEDGYGNSPFASASATTTVPVPAAVWLFGSALAGLGWMRRRKTA